MYPRLWVPQLRGHILKNFAWNTLLLFMLPILYVLLPQIVAIGDGYLRGSGYVPSELEQRFFDDHWKIIGLTALFAFGAAEVQGYVLRRAKAEPFVNAPFQALIAELAQRARLPLYAGGHFHLRGTGECRGHAEPILRRQSARGGRHPGAPRYRGGTRRVRP